MTLLISVFAAVVCTALWYENAAKREMKIGILCWMYWGASLMWLVDAVFEYMEIGAEYFTPTAASMLNDFFLGISVIIFGLVVWLVYLLIKDPKGVIKEILLKQKSI